MIVLAGLCLALVVLVQWRVRKRELRKQRAAEVQTAFRPLSEFDARFPADRRVTGRRGRAGRGF